MGKIKKVSTSVKDDMTLKVGSKTLSSIMTLGCGDDFDRAKLDFARLLRELLQIDDLIHIKEQLPITSIKNKKRKTSLYVEVIIEKKSIFMTIQTNLLDLWNKIRLAPSTFKEISVTFIQRLIGEFYNIRQRLFPAMGNVVPC